MKYILNPNLLFGLIFCFSNTTFSQSRPSTPVEILSQKINQHLAGGLQYLASSQRKETINGHSFKGEWPTSMGLQQGFILLGNKNLFDDSNCFSTASIHNALARIYLKYPEYTAIPAMLDLSLERILAYKNNDKFNFWNALPPNRDLFRGENTIRQPLVRRPTNYILKTRYINNAANVVEDADDTSLGYLAIALNQKTKKLQRNTNVAIDSLPSIAPIFEKYRDSARKNFHWYNLLNGNYRNTNAYLTWLGDEYQFRKWSLLKVLGHNAIFFLPSSQCFPHAYKPYIPYGTNDLDAVVNANILSALATYNELDAKGVSSAIKFIESKSKSEAYSRAGVYYPNRYQFPYAVSQAYANGVNQLKPSTEYLLKFILEHQKKDGSWSSDWRLNKKDKLQSTAYALNTLVNIGNISENGTKIPIEKAINYLLERAIFDSDGVHWQGGVFFSGGTVVRNTLLWKSDAYTTVIILNALANYRQYLEQNSLPNRTSNN